MDEASDAFEIRKDLSDLVTELPKVSEGLATGVLADKLSDDVPRERLAHSLAADNTQAASYLLYLSEKLKVEDGVTLMGAMIYDMMRSSGPLPVVTTKAIKDVDNGYKLNNDLYAFARYNEIKKSNPAVHTVIEKFSMQTDKVEPAMKVLTLFYSAFERQAELNKRKIS